MPATQFSSAQSTRNPQNLIRTNVNYTTLAPNDTIDVTGPGVTVKLTQSPIYGERKRIIATGGDVTVDGNGHTVTAGGTVVPMGVAKDYSFTTEWVTTVGEQPGSPIVVGAGSILLFGALKCDSNGSPSMLFPGYSDTVTSQFPVSLSDPGPQMRIPNGINGTLSGFKVHHGNPSSNSITYTLFVNNVATAITATVLANQSDATSIGTAFAASNDLVDVRATYAPLGLQSPEKIVATVLFGSLAGPTGATGVGATGATGATGSGSNGSVILFGNSAINDVVSPQVLSPGYSDTVASTLTQAFSSPGPGTYSKFKVVQNLPSGTPIVISYTVFINGIATALTITVNSSSSGGSSVATVAVSENDLVEVRVTNGIASGGSPFKIVASLLFT